MVKWRFSRHVFLFCGVGLSTSRSTPNLEDITDIRDARMEEKSGRMEATFEGGQGPEGAVVPWMDGNGGFRPAQSVRMHAAAPFRGPQRCWTFLGVFAELRKATISFVMSVRPSVRMEQLGSPWTDFDEI